MNKPLYTFLDSIGRTIMGELSSEDENYLFITNPVIVHSSIDKTNNKISLHLLPVFIREFMADKEKPLTWKYNKRLLSAEAIGLETDARFLQQYSNVFPAPVTTPSAPATIRLFDEK